MGDIHSVLLIEDDEKRALKINRYIHENGGSALVVATVEKACEAMACQEFDAVFIEMFMRAITGFEVVAELRKRNADTPIIVFYGGPEVNDGGLFSNRNGVFFATEEKKSFELEKYIF